MSSKSYIVNGDVYMHGPSESQQVESLPPGNFIVSVTPMGQFYLKKVDDFAAPAKIYGNTLVVANRILDTFHARPNTTGVSLSGEKGSGKTLTGRMISILGAKRGLPTLIINTPFVGDAFNNFIQDIRQPTIIFFDEFEKVYDREHQEQILTLLDGVFPSKKLFVITCNDKYRLDQHLNNRPGRIFYAIDYKGLDASFVEEYAKDQLRDQSQVQGLCNASALFSTLNFDMLQAIVEEMNRYGESALDAMRLLNAKPLSGGEDESYDASLAIDGKRVQLHRKEWRGRPLEIPFVQVYQIDPKDEDGVIERKFPISSIKRLDPRAGTITFVVENMTLELQKKPHYQLTAEDAYQLVA